MRAGRERAGRGRSDSPAGSGAAAASRLHRSGRRSARSGRGCPGGRAGGRAGPAQPGARAAAPGRAWTGERREAILVGVAGADGFEIAPLILF